MSEEDFDYSKYLTPPAAAEPAEPEPDYGAMPWKEVAYQGAKNLLPSAKNALMAIPEAVINYEQTGEALKQLGTGIASKAKGAVGIDQDAEQKAHDEALLNAMAEPYTSVAGFKKALATDPFSVLSTAAIPLTMGASGLESGAATLGKIGQTGSKAAQYASKATELGSKGLNAASYAVDPLKSAIGATGVLADYRLKASNAAFLLHQTCRLQLLKGHLPQVQNVGQMLQTLKMPLTYLQRVKEIRLNFRKPFQMLLIKLKMKHQPTGWPKKAPCWLQTALNLIGDQFFKPSMTVVIQLAEMFTHQMPLLTQCLMKLKKRHLPACIRQQAVSSVALKAWILGSVFCNSKSIKAQRRLALIDKHCKAFMLELGNPSIKWHLNIRI